MKLEDLKGKLIVSCQALDDEPLFYPGIMGHMALAAYQGGASAIRAQSVEQINEIRKYVDLPIIGIIKKNYEDCEVFITPTTQDVKDLLTTDCEVIAVDGTNRVRPHNEKLIDLLNLIHDNNRYAMADCSTFEECKMCADMGFDIVSTTLTGYTSYSNKIEGPDFELLKKCVDELDVKVIAEGKINTPEDLKKVYEYCKVFSAVVGAAITRPKLITERFVKVLK